MSALPYPDLDALPPELRELATRKGSLNIVRMIMHTPALAPKFLALAGAVMERNSLPPTWRELVILRVGFRYRSDYELHQHLKFGRAAGLREDEIAAAEQGSTDVLGEQKAILLRLTDLLLDNHTLSETERADALQTLTVNQLADFTITVGFYQLVCNFLNTFGVTTDGEDE
ncbi:carboxymuconolactone decarboxylase [Mycobacterium asiaticum]|uniref:Carboxymuconolactone decarboxylase n=1 Tax=Mycobacterium asiaticum TaxID=1790 RepID=A0A1A3P8J9_MYCAS|nr:carboxymuconolactone decarboxylase family protein [Mycobacterium asiaticum]OBK30558.1 carboxymuconolactone decarboxylase [Mycobacterium asiaticum]